jgi:hypothetical protein
MIILLLILAILGWLAAIISFTLLFLAALAMHAQEARFAEEKSDLVKSRNDAILKRKIRYSKE